MDRVLPQSSPIFLDQLKNDITEWKDKHYQLELELTNLKLSLDDR